MEAVRESKMNLGLQGREELELYLHIPFCVRKCDYCDFLSAPSGDAQKKLYFDALLKEIRSYEGRTAGYRVSSIFIGGGTPSCVDARYIKEALDTIRRIFAIEDGEAAVEITIEVNPGTIDREKLQIYKEAGINRISFGLQSTLDRELKLLGRIHDYSQFLDNFRMARELGYGNINVDLMSALPGQTLEDWEATLKQVAELKPEHISAYSLIIEEGTPFYERYGEGKAGEAMLPGEDLDRLIYARTQELLEEYGYQRYEISNYSRKGFECRHNLGYWTGTQYLGLGLGSSSLIQNTRFHNVNNLEEYMNSCTQSCINKKYAPLWLMSETLVDLLRDDMQIRRELQPLTQKMRMEEFMFLGLRVMDGIHIAEFKRRFDRDLDEVFGDIIRKFKAQGLLEESMDSLRLTERGIDVSNIIFAQFLLD